MSVQTEITRLSNAKSAIKTAIGNKGVTVPSTTKLDGMATLIGQIQTGTDTSDATAAAGDILSGKTAYVDGEKITGTIATKTSSNLTASGATVTVPAGYYASQATKSVATGSATAPASISGSSATVSTGTNTLTLSKTVSVTPSVSAGYVSSGTAGNSSVSLTASVTTKAAATITPTTSNQTIAAGTYLTGAQTIAGSSNLVAGNIKSGVSIFGVSGSYSGTKPTLKIAYHQSGSGTATGDNTRPLYPGMTLMAGGSLRMVGSGTLNLETGVLTETMSYGDAYNTNFTYNAQGSSYVVFRAGTSILNGTTLVSNMFTKKDDNPWKIVVYQGYLYLSIPSSLGITTSADFMTYLQSHNFCMIGSRKTALNITLTQSELAAIIQ